MKNFDWKKILMGVTTVVVGIAVYEFGKKQLDKSKTTPPSIK